MDQEDASATLNNGFVVQTPVIKKKRNLPGNPDPDSEVIALSPKTLMTTNRFLCEVCGKGFPRDQNLQLHRRGHNLPWKLKQRNSKDVIRKRVYVCPEKTCVHHHPSRALGDLTGIKKHFCRKHGEKKWKCEKCSKKYAVQSDWKAHSKTCGTREYRCDCGTVFSRRDSFITHRAFCDALAEETARINAASHFSMANGNLNYNFMGGVPFLHGGGGLMQAPQQQQQQQQFSNLFKPFLKEDHDETRVNAIIDHHHHHHQIQKGNNNSLPPWIMGQDPSALISHTTTADVINQQMGLPPINNNPFYTSPQSVVSCSDPQQDAASNSYQMSWFLGDMNKMCPTNGEEQHPQPQPQTLTCSSSMPLMNTTTSVPSIYSNQHQASTSSPHMSATALLQKAAQIGATASDPVFLEGLRQADQNSLGHDHHLSKYGGGSGGSGGELGGYGSNSTTTNLVGSDVESTENVFSPMSSHNHQVDMFPVPNKRRRVMQEQDQYRHYRRDQAEEGGQTRDFLGVGVESICHPSPITGWI